MATRTSRRSPVTTSLLALWAGAASISFSPSSVEAAPCAPVRALSDPSTLPLAWRAAFEALIGSTSRDGLPWSCPGGTIELAPATREATGVLTFTDVKGRKTTRPVTSPAEVGPTGKALLAAPPGAGDEPVIVSAPPAPPMVTVLQKEAPRAAPPADPRLLLAITGGPRMSGPDATVWMSTAVRAAIPIGPWSLGLWTRFDLPVAMARVISPNFSVSSVSIGLSGGRSFAIGPLALEALLAPSAAVVSMELVADENVKHPEGARVAFRLGAELGASARINDWLRARVAFDGEVTPADAALIADGFPHPPRYMLGLSLGLEAVIH